MTKQEAIQKIKFELDKFDNAFLDGPFILVAGVKRITDILRELIRDPECSEDDKREYYSAIEGLNITVYEREILEASDARKATRKKNAARVRAIEYEAKVARAIEQVKRDLFIILN